MKLRHRLPGVAAVLLAAGSLTMVPAAAGPVAGTGASPSVPGLAVAAKPERVCTHTAEASEGPSGKANVSACAVTNGQTLKVSFHADCFTAGRTQLEECYPRGTWHLMKGSTTVAEGPAGDSPVDYPGPGSYTLKGSATVEGHSDPQKSGGIYGIKVRGDMSWPITFTTARAAGPRLIGSTSNNEALSVTVKNTGDGPAKDVSIALRSGGSSIDPKKSLSEDKRCAFSRGETVCKVGDLAPDASVSITLTRDAQVSCAVEGRNLLWRYRAANYPSVDGDGPC